MSRILVIGEAQSIERAVRDLRKAGHQVFEAKARSRTAGAVRDVVPDVVVLEAAHPIGDDEPLFQDLAQDPMTRLVPVVHLVADRASVLKSLRLGAQDALPIAARGEELLARVEAALRVKANIDALVEDRQRAVLLELAGAVAHRMNQPLTSLSMSAELLLAAIDGPLDRELLRERLEEMIRQVDRLSDIVRRVGEIVSYRTTSYVGTTRIVDLEASGPDDGEDS